MGEYIFVHSDGTRKTAMQFAGRLEKAEIALGWEKQKRSHCIRRTVASRMNANHIPLETIRAWLGHTDTQTTLKYIFNPFRVDDTIKYHVEILLQLFHICLDFLNSQQFRIFLIFPLQSPQHR